MNRTAVACALVLLALWSAPAPALNWSLGTNVGLSVLTPERGGNHLINFSWPAGGDKFLAEFLPGLRLGALWAAEKHEVYLDTGANVLSDPRTGDSIRNLLATLNYQYGLATDVPLAPFVTVGAGVTNAGGFAVGEGRPWTTNWILGGGIGALHRLGNGHGAVRGEVRVDRITGDEEGILGGNLLSLKLGFDLWMK